MCSNLVMGIFYLNIVHCLDQKQWKLPFKVSFEVADLSTKLSKILNRSWTVKLLAWCHWLCVQWGTTLDWGELNGASTVQCLDNDLQSSSECEVTIFIWWVPDSRFLSFTCRLSQRQPVKHCTAFWFRQTIESTSMNVLWGLFVRSILHYDIAWFEILILECTVWYMVVIWREYKFVAINENLNSAVLLL
jgi:hypothetical protein